jgi:TrmH family RNA methyltransferase
MRIRTVPGNAATDPAGVVRRLLGARAIEAALDAGMSVRRILVQEGERSAETERLVARARAAGIPVIAEGHREMWRMSPPGECLEALGLAGRNPDASLADALGGGGAVWLLARVDYPSNVGVAIRTAEVGGADAVVVDARFASKERKEALRVSIRADRFMPVFWERARRVLDLCAATPRRIVAVESTGGAAPWDVDLRGPVLLVVGNESHGIAPEILAACDEVIRVPMAGFIPAYNVQAALAAVATERLRQLSGARSHSSPVARHGRRASQESGACARRQRLRP